MTMSGATQMMPTTQAASIRPTVAAPIPVASGLARQSAGVRRGPLRVTAGMALTMAMETTTTAEAMPAVTTFMRKSETEAMAITVMMVAATAEGEIMLANPKLLHGVGDVFPPRVPSSRWSFLCELPLVDGPPHCRVGSGVRRPPVLREQGVKVEPRV